MEPCVSITIYSFYNNKGGVGKTTLCQNAASLYAENNPEKQVIVIDLCPQANISQFFLGGGHHGYDMNQRIQSSNSRKNIVGFMDWLLKGNSGFSSIKSSYAIQASKYNANITPNLYLIAGDSFLESLSLALNYAVINPANIRAWGEYMTAIRRLCRHEHKSDDFESLTVFIDCNPSFSIYTQMGLVSSDFLIVPMMADFSSLEGIKGIMMLLYAKYPSAAVKRYADDIVTFDKKIIEQKLKLPRLYEFVFNNFTSNKGVAKAYESVRSELIDFCYEQWDSSKELFARITSEEVERDEWEGLFVSNVKDFHTVGKISSSLGIPLHRLCSKSQYEMPDGTSVQISPEGHNAAVEHISKFTNKLI
jgi:cellulose biosynthesis protein BcsQ